MPAWSVICYNNGKGVCVSIIAARIRRYYHETFPYPADGAMLQYESWSLSLDKSNHQSDHKASSVFLPE